MLCYQYTSNIINLYIMELSILLAKIFGLVYIAVGLGMLINRAYYRKVLTDMATSSALLMYGGAAALVVGLVMVLNHNLWAGGWEIIITIIAWLALLKGVLLLLAPKAMIGLTKMITKNESVFVLWAVLALILGLILGYFGFVA